jgi:hypothetical protein
VTRIQGNAAPLHFSLDLWFEKKFKAQCRGEAYLVRFADDFVGSFQFWGDAQFVRGVCSGMQFANERCSPLRFNVM